jgi:hypothetical protein
VVCDLDIRRAANSLLREHGAAALLEAARLDDFPLGQSGAE